MVDMVFCHLSPVGLFGPVVLNCWFMHILSNVFFVKRCLCSIIQGLSILYCFISWSVRLPHGSTVKTTRSKSTGGRGLAKNPTAQEHEWTQHRSTHLPSYHVIEWVIKDMLHLYHISERLQMWVSDHYKYKSVCFIQGYGGFMKLYVHNEAQKLMQRCKLQI